MDAPSTRRISRALLARVAFANLVGATLNSVVPTADPRAQSVFFRGGVWLFAAYMAASITILSLIGVWLVRRALRWLNEGREPTAEERRRVLKVPLTMAIISLVGWTGGGIVFAVRIAAIGGTALDVWVTVARNVLFGTATAAIAYLLAETSQRQVIARAFAGGSDERPTSVGLRGRLLAAWILGSAGPLLTIGIAFAGRDASARAAFASYAWVYVLVGAFVGFVVLRTVSSSIVTPVEGVRRALRTIEGGRLDVRVPVDDGSELGQLQYGFNEMVVGLRERQRLHDLFGRHVGDEVAAQALERGVRLGGERCEASALFIDLIGSTTMAERLSPDEVASILNDVFAEVVSAVRAEGGWVNKFEGDAALCVFGPPVGHSDHAARAVRAAVAVRDGLRRVTLAHADVDAGVGVASGVVFAGNVGAEDRYEYTVIGDAVNRAARITELAKTRPGRLLVAEDTLEAAGLARDGWTKAHEDILRGRTQATVLYEPVSEGR